MVACKYEAAECTVVFQVDIIELGIGKAQMLELGGFLKVDSGQI